MKNWRTLKKLLDVNALEDFIKMQFKENFGSSFEVDVYAYINDEETEVTFEKFTNIGGSSWLNDDHFTLYRFYPTYQNLSDEFNSDMEFVDYMVELYGVAVPFDEFTDDDGDIDYYDCKRFILEECKTECERAISDIIDETWGDVRGDVLFAILNRIDEEIELEDGEL